MITELNPSYRKISVGLINSIINGKFATSSLSRVNTNNCVTAYKFAKACFLMHGVVVEYSIESILATVHVL